jgi:uncharacterized delta-60 repeat protein
MKVIVTFPVSRVQIKAQIGIKDQAMREFNLKAQKAVWRWFAIFAANFVLIGFILSPAVAAVKIAWTARYHGVGKDNHPRDFKVDGQGNIYVTGYSDGIKILAECATVKYSPAGRQLWARRFSQNGWGGGCGLAVDSPGNVYIAGWVGGHDHSCLTLKYNAAGVQQWAAIHGDDKFASAGTALAVTQDGKVYVTKYSDVPGQAGYYNDTLKYNSAGKVQWVRRNVNVKTDLWWETIAVDSGGNAYVTGSADFNDGYNSDYITRKYSSGGARLWEARYRGIKKASDDDHQALALDPNGNVIVTGRSGVLSSDNTDYATVKYSPAGKQLWVARYHGPVKELDTPEALAVDGQGNIYVTGHSEGKGTYIDYATVKYSPAGKQLWVARYNGPDSLWDRASSVAVDTQGNIYVTGISYNTNFSVDYATLKYSPAGEQLWVTRYPAISKLLSPSRDPKLALDPWGNVVVSREYRDASGNTDYLTIKYKE